MLLIHPASEKFGGPMLSSFVPVEIPVSLGTLSAYLKKYDINAKIIDEEMINITPSILREAVENMERPYIFGITCLTAHVRRSYEIAQMIKEIYTDSIVITGGLHPTTLPDESLNTGFVDYVVRGEGEEIMLQLYRAIRGEGNPRDILGVSYIEEGVIKSNSPASLIPDINVIPNFPYHEFDHDRYDFGMLVSSRGCPYRCSYCSQRLLTGTTYRYLSPERIIEQLDILVNTYHQKQVVFFDDNFCLVNKRVHDLCDMLIENGFPEKVSLGVQTRADNVLHGGDDLVRHMAEAGFSNLGYGLETGVQRLADITRKDETIEQHLEATWLAKKHGMTVSLFMIFGMPTETREDRKISYDVVGQAMVIETKFNNMIPYPGTPIYEEVKNTDRLVISENWGNFNSTLAMTRSIFDKTPLPYVPETCSEWELKRDIIRYNYKSYLLNARAIKRILTGQKGSSWFLLPDKWYLSLSTWVALFHLGFNVIVNLTMALLPIWITEPIMCAYDKKLKKRKRIKNYDPNSYETKDWDKDETKNIMRRLKKAKDHYKDTGDIKLVTNDSYNNDF